MVSTYLSIIIEHFITKLRNSSITTWFGCNTKIIGLMRKIDCVLEIELHSLNKLLLLLFLLALYGKKCAEKLKVNVGAKIMAVLKFS